MSIGFFRRFTKRILVGTNITVAIGFLLGCYGGWFDPKHYWFTGFFTLAAFYLGLLLLGFILLWLFTRPKLMLISVCSLLLAWSPIKQLVKLRLSSNFSFKKEPAVLRVMSWNVEHFDILEHKSHPETKKQMIELVSQFQPDIACFQEMVGSDSVPAAINYIPDFMKRFNMGYYHYSFNPKIDFDKNHHFGLITFSKYPILHRQTISYPPHDYNAVFQYIDIVKDGDTFRIFNIHLQSLKFSDDNLRYIKDPSIENKAAIQSSKNIVVKFRNGFLKRQVQSDRIRAEMNRSPYPVIICGDFNDVPNSYAYNTIGKGMKNAFAEMGTGIGRTFYGISPVLRIDNIFVDERFSFSQFVRVRKKLSDHFPLVADLYYKKE